MPKHTYGEPSVTRSMRTGSTCYQNATGNVPLLHCYTQNRICYFCIGTAEDVCTEARVYTAQHIMPRTMCNDTVRLSIARNLDMYSIFRATTCVTLLALLDTDMYQARYLCMQQMRRPQSQSLQLINGPQRVSVHPQLQPHCNVPWKQTAPSLNKPHLD